jgi:hypothetical protein
MSVVTSRLDRWIPYLLCIAGSISFLGTGRLHPPINSSLGTLGSDTFYRAFAAEMLHMPNWGGMHLGILAGPVLWALATAGVARVLPRRVATLADVGRHALLIAAALWSVGFVLDGFVGPALARHIAAAGVASDATAIRAFSANQLQMARLGMLSIVLIGAGRWSARSACSSAHGPSSRGWPASSIRDRSRAHGGRSPRSPSGCGSCCSARCSGAPPRPRRTTPPTRVPMPPDAPETVRAQLERAAAGVLFVSEGETRFTAVSLPPDAPAPPIGEEEVRRRFAIVASEPVNARTLDDFFSYGTEPDPADAASAAVAPKVVALREAIRSLAPDARAFRVGGGAQVRYLVVGHAAGGGVVGVETVGYES